MDIAQLEHLMRENNLVIRAIPSKVTHIYEVCHQKEHPNGVIRQVPGFPRPMLVVEEVPPHAGMFIAERQDDTSFVTRFHPKTYYGSLEEIVESL